jgi:hypothetical protein
LQKLLKDKSVNRSAQDNEALKRAVKREVISDTPDLFLQSMKFLFESTVEQALMIATAKLLVSGRRVDPLICDNGVLFLAACQNDYTFFKSLLEDSRVDPYFQDGVLIKEIVSRNFDDFLYAVLKSSSRKMSIEMFRELMKIALHHENLNCVRHLLQLGYPLTGIPNLLEHYIRRNHRTAIEFMLLRQDVQVRDEYLELAICLNRPAVLSL